MVRLVSDSTDAEHSKKFLSHSHEKIYCSYLSRPEPRSPGRPHPEFFSRSSIPVRSRRAAAAADDDVNQTRAKIPAASTFYMSHPVRIVFSSDSLIIVVIIIKSSSLNVPIIELSWFDYGRRVMAHSDLMMPHQ